jgi:stage II sporulation protein M
MGEIFKESKSYLSHIQIYIWISLAIFLLSAVAGFYASQYYLQEIQSYLDEAEIFFSSMQSPTLWGTFLMILQNNVEAMLLIVFLGVFVGFFSFAFLIANGFIVGVFAHLFYMQNMLLLFFVGIFPHGIVEIPCMLFSAAIGFRIGKTVIDKIFYKKTSLTAELSEGIKFAVTIIVPALVLAALIETYITPLFIALVQTGPEV